MEYSRGCLQDSVNAGMNGTAVSYGCAVGHYQRLMRLSKPDYGKDLIRKLFPPKEEEHAQEES